MNENDNLDEIVAEYKKGNFSRAGYFTDLDCLEKFVELVIKNQSGKKYTFSSYNGAAFDNFLLFEAFEKKDLINLKSVLFCNN